MREREYEVLGMKEGSLRDWNLKDGSTRDWI